MPPYKKGIENIPLRQFDNTPYPILVLIADLTTDEVIQEHRLDYSSFEDRKHLGRLTHWAIRNHCSIETMAVADAEPPLNQGIKE